MTFTQTCTITASRDVVWDFLLQAENVAHCLAGVEAFKQLDEDNYEGTLRVRVGPIALALQGILHVEARDREQWHGAMRAEAKDRRLGGGIRAHLSMDLREKGPTESIGKIKPLFARAPHRQGHAVFGVSAPSRPLYRRGAGGNLPEVAAPQPPTPQPG